MKINGIRQTAGAGRKQMDICFLFLMVGTGIVLLWKCRYGFGNRDEAFYLTVPYRLWQGDALFSQEWHLSQMAGLLLLPFVTAYMEIVGSTTGILLAFRRICTLVWWTGACVLYFRMRKNDQVGAALAAILFVLYIPFGIMALSYNSMGIWNLLMAAVLLQGKKRKGEWILSGILFSAAVLCCPYLAFVYFLYTGVTLVKSLMKKGERDEKEQWFYFSAGIAGSVLVFLVFALGRASLQEIIGAVPFIFRDPEHHQKSLWKYLLDYVNCVFHCTETAPAIYTGMVILILAVLADKKREKHGAVYISVACVLTLMLQISVLIWKQRLNYLMFPLNLIGAFCYFLMWKNHTLSDLLRNFFVLFWIPGILYSFCISMTSNQGFYAVSSASTVAAVGSTIIVVLTVKGMMKQEIIQMRDKKILIMSVILVFLLQLGSEAVLRYQTVFWEDSLREQNCLITEGPEAGLYVTEGKQRMYLEILEDLKPLKEAETVLFLSKNTWMYLCGDWRMGSYSAWLSGVNELTMERLEGYYRRNPIKMPDMVWAEKKYEPQADWLCARYGYKKKAVKSGFLLF